MGKNKEYAQRLKEMEGYERDILAIKLCDEIPENAESYGEDFSFECAIFAELWEKDKKPVCLNNKNILCGGAVYSGLGCKKLSKEDFDYGMETTVGQNKAYSSREVLRRVNQQIPHFFKHHKYMVVGKLEDVEDPDVVIVVTDANRVMRLCKVYTWKTGELVHGVSGTAWCANSLPLVYSEKTMTFNMGDPPSRFLMKLDPGEMFCLIHYDLLPLIVENFENISDGAVA